MRNRMPNYAWIAFDLIMFLACISCVGYCAATMFVDFDTTLIKIIGLVVCFGLAWLLGLTAFFRITSPADGEHAEREVLTIEELEELNANNAGN